MKNNKYYQTFDFLYFSIKQNLRFLLFNFIFLSTLFIFELEIEMSFIYLIVGTSLPPSIAMLLRNYDQKLSTSIEIKLLDQLKQYLKLWIQLLPLSLIFNVIIFSIVFFPLIQALLSPTLLLVISSLSIVYLVLFIPFLYHLGINRSESLKDILFYSLYKTTARIPIAFVTTLLTLVFVYFLIINPILLVPIFPSVLTMGIYHFSKLLSYKNSIISK